MCMDEVNWPTFFLNSYLLPWIVLAIFQEEGVKCNSFLEVERRESEAAVILFLTCTFCMWGAFKMPSREVGLSVVNLRETELNNSPTKWQR